MHFSIVILSLCAYNAYSIHQTPITTGFTMKKLTLLFLLSLMTYPLFAADFEYDFDRESARLISSDQNGVVIELITPDFVLIPENLDGRDFSRIKINGWGVTGEFGKPELPVISRNIALPHGAGIEYNFEVIESEIIKDVLINPLQEYRSDNRNVETPAYVEDVEFFERDEFYPSARVTISDPVIMRDLRMARVTINPFRYNPVRQELEVVRKMRVTVNFNDSIQAVNPKTNRRERISASFVDMYRSIAENFDDLEMDEVVERGGYIFVVPNATIETLIDTLVKWKKEKGFPVDVVSTQVIGSSITNIRSYISDAYYNWEIPPEFVVLVGDIDGSYSIATDYYYCGTSDNSVTDHYYAKLEGTDYFPDVMVGRLSIRSITELNTVMSKIIGYETMLTIPWTDWILRAEMIADSSNISCQLTKEYGAMECLRNGYTQVYEDYFSWSAPSTIISSHINTGVSIVNFRGYQNWGGWNQPEISSLTNYWKLPVVNGCTCETGSFENMNCISEAWLRAGTANSPKGGMGCVGPSSWNTHTKWNNCLDAGFMWGFLNDDLEFWMETIWRGKMELWNNFPYNHGSGNPSNSVDCYYHIYNLVGDPGLSVRTQLPDTLYAEIPGDIPLGNNFYPVYIYDQNDDAVEGAFVNLWKGDEVYIGGFTDENGEINFPIEPETAGYMKVCATIQNSVPFRQAVQILTGEQFVGVSDTDFDDDNTGGSSGNGDGILNPGETIELDIKLENFGTTSSTGVTGEIYSNNQNFSIISGLTTFGSIAGGDTAWGNDTFVFSIAEDCPHGENVEIMIRVTDLQMNEWMSILVYEVGSADMNFAEFNLPGAGTNGLLDPGETSTLTVTLRNVGTYSSEELTGILTCESDKVTILDGSGSFSAIAPEMTGNNSGDTFELTTPMTTFPGTKVSLILQLTSVSGFDQLVEIEMYLGIPNSDDPLIPDDYGYYCYDDTDIGYIPVPSFNDWVEISRITQPLNLPDYGEDDDCSIVVSFPPEFSFRYYGQDYDRITVCSNGWASLGSTWMCNFRNFPIIGAQVAPACLAPFWDDLKMTSGGGTNGKVFAYYDDAASKYIIEWHDVQNRDGNNSLQTFEIVLYDPILYPTPTGDGIIDFFYEIVNNNGNEHNATVGIATPWNGDGVSYTYANQYPPGAVALHNGQAIRFTTQTNETMEPPVIEVTPALLIIDIPEGEVGSGDISIANNGASMLVYNIGWDIVDLLDTKSTITVPGGGGNLDELGGPDNWGYTYIDSDEPTGPEYNWIDITETGTEIIFVHNDSATLAMPIGFEFPFYGEVFEEYYLSANGWLSFTSRMSAWSNLQLPDPAAPENLIAPCWDDLDPLEGEGAVYAWNNGTDSLVISFIDVSHWGTSYEAFYTFQLILTANGSIKMQYADIEGPDLELYTIGIQNSDGADGLTVAHNEEYIHSELAVEFNHPFLRIEPDAGSAAPGNSTDVAVTAYTYGIETFTTVEGEIAVGSNDPVNPVVTIPLYINVGFVGVEDPGTAEAVVPQEFKFYGASPNPFNPTTYISFDLPEKSRVEAAVYDVLGRKAAVLKEGTLEAGYHRLEWGASQMSSGVYFVQVRAGARMETAKVMLLK